MMPMFFCYLILLEWPTNDWFSCTWLAALWRCDMTLLQQMIAFLHRLQDIESFCHIWENKSGNLILHCNFTPSQYGQWPMSCSSYKDESGDLDDLGPDELQSQFESVVNKWLMTESKYEYEQLVSRTSL